MGGVFQQATSGVTETGKLLDIQLECIMLMHISLDASVYELGGMQYSTYGFQYQPGFDNAVSARFALGSRDIHTDHLHSTSAGLPMASSPGR